MLFFFNFGDDVSNPESPVVLESFRLDVLTAQMGRQISSRGERNFITIGKGYERIRIRDRHRYTATTISLRTDAVTTMNKVFVTTDSNEVM